MDVAFEPYFTSLSQDSSRNISYWNRANTTGTGPWNQCLSHWNRTNRTRAARHFRSGSEPTGPWNPTVLLELDQPDQLDQPDRATWTAVHRPLAGSWFWSRHEDHVARLLSKFCGEIVEEEAEGEEIADASDEIRATGAANCLVPWLGANLVAHRWKLQRRL